MWDTGSEFRHDTMTDFSYPKFEVFFYDDEFEFTGADWSGTYSKYFYDITNAKNFVTAGTSTLDGMLLNGTRIELDGTGTIGTWTSPILTPFYKGDYTKLTYNDFTSPCEECDDILFTENFESLNSIERNGGILNLSEGTIVYLGGQNDSAYNTANWLKIVNQGDAEITQVHFPNLNIPTAVTESGEVHLKFKFDNYFNSSLVYFAIITDEIGQISLQTNVTGTHQLLTVTYLKGASGGTVLLGTVGTGAYNDVHFSWDKNPSDFLNFYAWWNGTLTAGTITKILNFGNYDYTILGLYEGGTSGTYYLDDIFLYGTRLHDNTWTGGHLSADARIDYYIQTGTDGTNFESWQQITGTRNYITENRSLNQLNTFYIGTFVQQGEFFKMRTVTSHPDVTPVPYIDSLTMFSQYDFDENAVSNIGNISHKTESNFRIGEIIVNNVDMKISNIKSIYGSTDRLFGEVL